MDLLTHVLVAYLLTYGLVGLQPQYLAAGALAGGIPDADALLFPLSRRFPILRHHGITHSLLGVTIVASVGAFVAPMILAGSPLVYFIVMEVGGIAHILQDGFTQFSVPPLMPFSDKRLQLDADRAINFVTLVVSAVGFYVLLGVERNHVALGVYVGTLWVLTAFFVAYFAIRLAGRAAIGKHRMLLGVRAQPVPSGNPFRWLLLSEELKDGRMRTTWARYVLGRGITEGPFSVEGPMEPAAHLGAPANATEALEWSYPLARRASRVIETTYHFGEAFQEAAGTWVAVWYSLEFTMFGRSPAVRVRFPTQGGPAEVHSTFYRPVQHSI
ncbi:MAG: metal-dependent hydrolase [Thermoplasmata archaeon]